MNMYKKSAIIGKYVRPIFWSLSFSSSLWFIFEFFSINLYLTTCLAGAKDKWYFLISDKIQRRLCSFKGIGSGMEQGAIKVCKYHELCHYSLP